MPSSLVVAPSHHLSVSLDNNNNNKHIPSHEEQHPLCSREATGRACPSSAHVVNSRFVRISSLASSRDTAVARTAQISPCPNPASFEQQIHRNVDLSLQRSPVSHHRQMECFVLSTKRSINSEQSFLPVFHSVRNGVSRLLLRSGSRATLISTVVTFRE